jgi:fucose permease
VVPVVVRQRPVAFALGCWAFVLLGWAGLLVPALAREVEDGFTQTDVGLGLFYFLTAVAYAAGSILGGMATERIGRRAILSGAAALLGVGLIAQGLSPDWWAFTVFGIVRSVGSGAIDGGGNGLVLDLYQGAKGGRLNLLHLFFSVGALGAPFVLAARDLVGLSWQAVIVGSGVLALPLAIAFAVTDLADGRARPDLAADRGRSSLLALPLLVLAVAIACYVACEVGVSNWLVRFLAAAPAATATSALGLYWAGLAAGRLAGSWIADRFDHLRLAIVAALACAVALVGAVAVPSLGVSIALFTLVGFASGPIFPLIVAVGGERFPDRAAAVSGLIVASSVVGAVVYPPLMGVMSVTVGLPVAMVGTAVVVAAGGGALVVVGRMPRPAAAAL